MQENKADEISLQFKFVSGAENTVGIIEGSDDTWCARTRRWMVVEPLNLHENTLLRCRRHPMNRNKVTAQIHSCLWVDVRKAPYHGGI